MPRPSGTLRKGRPVARCRTDGTIERARIAELYTTDALDRVPADEAGPGEIVAVAGIPEITIGETLADPDDPRPLPVITIDEPSLSMTVGINTSMLAGREGDKMTARMVKNRLDKELVGNVSIRVLPTERPDTWEVQGRGELQLAMLVEMMRREGFELTVGKPQVLTRLVDGAVHEPVDRLTVDVPEEFMGVVTQLLALRKGRMEQIVNHGTGWVRLDYLVPARGPDRLPHRVDDRDAGHRVAAPRVRVLRAVGGDLRTRPTGSLVADRHGPTTGYALLSLQERGQLFVGPGIEVYEGMIVGENARADDMDVNPTKEKKLTNMRASTSDDFVRLIPPRRCRWSRRSSSSPRTSASRSPPQSSACARWPCPPTSARRAAAGRAAARRDRESASPGRWVTGEGSARCGTRPAASGARAAP